MPQMSINLHDCNCIKISEEATLEVGVQSRKIYLEYFNLYGNPETLLITLFNANEIRIDGKKEADLPAFLRPQAD